MPCFISQQELDRDKSHCNTNSEGDSCYTWTIWAQFTRVTLTFFANLTCDAYMFGPEKPYFGRKIKNYELARGHSKCREMKLIRPALKYIRQTLSRIEILVWKLCWIFRNFFEFSPGWTSLMVSVQLKELFALFYSYWRIPENVFEK